MEQFGVTVMELEHWLLCILDEVYFLCLSGNYQVVNPCLESHGEDSSCGSIAKLEVLTDIFSTFFLLGILPWKML